MRTNKNVPVFHKINYIFTLQIQTPLSAPPPLRQEVTQLNYALAGAVNKLSGSPEYRGVQVPKESLS